MKILSLVVFASLVVLVSCKKEESDQTPPPTNEQQLSSDTWEVSDLNATGVVMIFGQAVPFVATTDSIDPASYFDFQETPNQLDYHVSAVMSVAIGGDLVEIPHNQSGTGTWELDGRDYLYVTQDAETVEYDILSWTSARLILRTDQAFVFNGEEIDARLEIELTR